MIACELTAKIKNTQLLNNLKKYDYNNWAVKKKTIVMIGYQ